MSAGDPSLSDLTRRLVLQSKELAETEVARLRLETEQRIAQAQRAAVALAIVLPLVTLALGAGASGFTLWLSEFTGPVAACFCTTGLCLSGALVVGLWLHRQLRLLAPATEEAS